MDLQGWAAQRFAPVVMVVSTTGAEAICQEKNSLSVTDMLRPYATLHNINVPVRTVGEHSYRLHEFKLRLHEATSMFQPSPEAAEAHLTHTLHSAAERHRSDEACDMASILSAAAPGAQTDPTPWFTEYREEFFRMLSFSDFECYDHPAACLYVASSDCADVVRAFEGLGAADRYPPLMKAGVMDPGILKHYVLLHDSKGGNLQAAEAMLAVMRTTFGPGACHLLKINSGTGTPADSGAVGALWRACFRPGLPGGGAGEPEVRVAAEDEGEVGLHLTAANLEGLAIFMRDFTVRGLVPYMEGRIRLLNHQITSTRRGLKNQLKALWWRKERTAEEVAASGAAAGGGTGYNHASVESQMRCLSDLAFMMHDHGLAASTLRLLQGDFKADKAFRHYAGAQEMLALCLVLGDGSSREAEDCLVQAFQAYSQAGPEYTRYATRALLLLSEIHKSRGRFREAKSVLMKAHFEEVHTRAALLLEQTASCLLQATPPLERKFAFHMILAGLRFHQSDQRLLAERCYRQVLAVYKGRRWSLIEEHLHDVLGRYAQEQGDQRCAVGHHMALLANCAHRGANVQEHYLSQLRDSVAAAEKAAAVAAGQQEGQMVLELPLPVVDEDRAYVHLDGVQYKGNPAASLVEDATWERLHECLAPGRASVGTLGGGSSNWLAGKSTKSLPEVSPNMCCAHEPVGVDIELSNPLAVTLQVLNIRLLCAHEPAPGSTSSSSDDDDLGAEEAPLPGVAFELLSQDLTLKAKERSRVRLTVTPRLPGTLRVRGVEWQLSQGIAGRKLFAQRAEPRWKDDLSHLRLVFSVIPPMPRLVAALHGLPSFLYAGEVARCFLELRNTNDVPLQGVKVAVSDPAALMLAAQPVPDDADAPSGIREAWRAEARCLQSWELPGGDAGSAVLQPPPALPSGEVPSMFTTSRPRMWALPKDLTLDKKASVHWPVWISPPRVGTHNLQLAISFAKRGGAPPAGGMRHRVLCIAHSVTVVPSVAVVPRLVRDPTHMHRRVLQLAMTNLQTATEHFRVQQVSCLTPGMQLQPLAAPATAQRSGARNLATAALVPPNEAAHLYLHLQCAEAEGQAEAEAAEAEGEAGTGALLPVARGPVAWFHACAAREAAGTLAGGASVAEVGAHVGQVALRLAVVWEVVRPVSSARLGTSLAALPLPLGGASPAEGADGGPTSGALHAVLQGPGRPVTHDFCAAPLCEVGLTLRVASALSRGALCHVDCTAPGGGGALSPGAWHAAPLPPPSAAQAPPEAGSAAAGPGAAPGHPAGLAPGPGWVWVGRTHAEIGPLGAGRPPAELSLRVAVAGPGRYQLDGVRLALCGEDGRGVEHSALCPPTTVHVLPA
eukprot:jgi/Tetstr1/459177/TSEL_004623.t1